MDGSAAIVDYYAQATADYRFWSRGGHMHFGCWQRGTRPWDREAMVEAMAARVLDRLALAPGCEQTVLDLGCGIGAAARQLAGGHRRVRVYGVSLDPQQVAVGSRLCIEADLAARVGLHVGDYRRLPLAAESAAGAYAIESACYDDEGGRGLIREAARVLAPGAALVIADGFRRDGRAPNRAAARADRAMREGWVLPPLHVIDEFTAVLREHGFVEIQVEDLSWRVMPSMLQVPLVSLGFWASEGSQGLSPRRRGNVGASLGALGCALLGPRRYGYYLVRARRGS